MRYQTLLFLVIITLTGCPKKNIEYKTVYNNSETDIEIREKPDMNSKTLDTIPFGEMLSLMETKGKEITISGITGKWNKIMWNQMTGWIFLNLTDTKPNNDAMYFNLIQRIKNAKQGDIIKVAEGKYYIDDTKGFNLKGINNLTIKSAINNKPAEFISNSSDLDIIIIKNCNKLTIDGLIIYHDVETDCSASCISIENSKDITISNCNIHGCGSYGINVLEDSNNANINITGNWIHNCSNYGLYYSSNKGIITGNSFYDNTTNMLIDENIKFGIELAENQEYLNTKDFNEIIGEYESEKGEAGEGKEKTPAYRLSIIKTDYIISIEILINDENGNYLVIGDVTDFSLDYKNNNAEYNIKLKGSNDEEYDLTLGLNDDKSLAVTVGSYNNQSEENLSFLREHLESDGYLDSFYRIDAGTDYNDADESENNSGDESSDGN